MADNKTYTLESAKELFAGDNWDTAVDNMSREEMMSLDEAIYGKSNGDKDIEEATIFVRDQALKRIETLLEQDIKPEDLDSVEDFVKQFGAKVIINDEIKSYASDAAEKLMAKVEKQKEELAQAASAQNEENSSEAEPITVEENAGDEQVLENKEENIAGTEGEIYDLGDESHTENTPENAETLDETAENADASKQEAQEQESEAETPIQETPQEEISASTEENTEEVEFPERREITKKEFPAMLDPLSEDMPEMTKDERTRQEERLEKVDELSENTEYHPEFIAKEGAENEPDPVYDTLKFTIEQGAVRKLTISEDEINEENLKKARAEEEERIALEYYNSVFGVCKTEEELDKETPQEHVERLGKVANLISQKKPKAEIYAAMGIQPTREQEQIAANAVYQTNAVPALEWAKKLGKAGLKYMDKYREFEKNNPMTSLGMGLVMAGNPVYMGARMALSARGLYKDYENYKKNHPNEKNTFLGMLKDKETRKSLMNNAGIFIRSVPVIGQAYGVTMMAKQLGKTCKKSFWKDLGNKFKDAGKAWKEVAKNPKDLSKWKDAAKKSQVPAAIVGGLALTAIAAYKGAEAYNERVEMEEQLKAEEAFVAIENEKLEINKPELLIALPKEEEEVNIQEEQNHHTPRASHTPRTPSEPAQEPAPKIDVDLTKLGTPELDTTATVPENLELAPKPEIHDEKFYQDMTDSTKGLNNEAQDALKDPNKTVDEAVDKHYEDQAAKGNITESQADKATTAVKGNIGTLYGKSDEDLTAKDVKEGIKTTEKALDAAKENADEFITAEQVGKNVDASEEGNYVHRHQEEHPDGYSQNIESSEACKGMENACNRMLSGARHGQNIGSMMNEEMKAGNLSEEQATAMNERWSELKHKGYSDERALSKMANDYHRIGNDYLKHQEYAAEHQNENAQVQTQQVQVEQPIQAPVANDTSDKTPTSSTNDGATPQTPETKTNESDPVVNLANNHSSLGFDSAEPLKEGQYVEKEDAQGYKTIVGKDASGNAFRLTEMNGGWTATFPEGSPYNDRINAPADDGFPKPTGMVASASAVNAMHSGMVRNEVTTELLNQVKGMQNVSDHGASHDTNQQANTPTGQTQEAASRTSGVDMSKTRTHTQSLLDKLSGRPGMDSDDKIPSKAQVINNTLSLSQMNKNNLVR